jgi:hypothetical protein
MFNAALLKTNFAGLVGFFQPYDPAYSKLPAFLNQSDSGRYLQTTHPLCTIENLFNIGPEFDKFDFPTWANQAYEANSVVLSNGKLWIASTDIAVDYGEPIGESAYSEEYDDNQYFNEDEKLWKEYDPFAEYLRNIYQAAVLQTFTDFLTGRKVGVKAKSLLDSQILYDGIGSYIDRIVKKGYFRGFEISLSSQHGISAIINKMGLQADEVQDITIYLYHTSQKEAIATFDLSVASASSFNWQTLENIMLGFYKSGYNTEGRFLLGYYEDDLVGQAIRMNYNFRSGACMGCDGPNYEYFNRWSKYVKISPFYVPSTAFDARNLFDLSKIVYDYQGNNGLNIAISVYCDLSDFFINNKIMFADALAYQIAIKLLGQIAYSTRMSAIPDKTKALAMADLSIKDEDSLVNKYKEELKGLELDFSGLSSACMPCKESKGVSMGAV